jgi:hypothetical protein
MLLSTLLCCTLAAPLVAQQSDSAAQSAPRRKFVGEIKSLTTARPVTGADVRLLFIDSVKTTGNAPGTRAEEAFIDSTRSRVGVTDSTGAFTIRDMTPGHYLVNVRRLGFEPFEGLLTLDTATVEMELAMTQVDAILPAVRITASSVNKVTERLDRMGFTERSRMGTSGRFVDRAEILRRRPVRITDLLETYGLHENANVEIDRMPADWSVLRDYPPDLVIGIEIYRRHGALPAEYNRTLNGPIIMAAGGFEAMMAPTVLVWTFIP